MRSKLAAIAAAAALAAGTAAPLAASAAPAPSTAQTSHKNARGPAADRHHGADRADLPPWLHVGRVRHFDACNGKGVIVWQTPVPGVNGTSAVHCRSGRTFLS